MRSVRFLSYRAVGLLFLAAGVSLSAAAQQMDGMGSQGAPAPAAAGISPSASVPVPGLSFGTARPVDDARGETLTLEQAFRAALLGSRDLEGARDRLVEAAIDLDRAWSTLRPNVVAVGALTRNDREVVFVQPDGTERVTQQLYQPGVSLSARQALFQGQALPTLRALRESQAATALQNERLRTEVLHAVATTFYSALALQDTVTVFERQLEDTARHLEVVEARFEVEATNRVDLLRAQIDQRSAAEDLRVAQASLASVKVALGTLIGRPHDEGDYRVVRPEAPPTEVLAADEAVATAYAERPDLAAVERQVVAADHLITAARMAFLPALDLNVSARYSPVISFLRDDRFTWQATVNLTVPIYQGGLNRQRLESAHVRMRQAQRARDSLADRVRQEVLQARLDLETAAAQLERLEGTATLAEETLDLVRARYEAGVATSLEVTDATTRNFLTQAQVLRGRLDLEMAVLSLARAMGMFDEVAGVSESPASPEDAL
jgi:outer membrane protein